MPIISYTDADLRMWRARDCLTQAQAAGLLGVSQRMVSRWELGAYPRDLKDRMDVAMAKTKPADAKMSAREMRELNPLIRDHRINRRERAKASGELAALGPERLADLVDAELIVMYGEKVRLATYFPRAGADKERIDAEVTRLKEQ